MHILKRPVYVIAEMSGNHNQSLEKALALVDAAADAGAHAIKLQTYTADTMTLDVCNREEFVASAGSPWSGRSLYDIYGQAYTPWEWHGPIMERAKHRGIDCFSSPFDETAVDFLETLSVPAYKIASFECIDLPLIAKVAATGKPLIISTGMASISEIFEAVEVARKSGCTDLVLLKCTSTYPAAPEHSNLLTLPHMKELFGCEVGLSDHTLGIGVALASVALGARVIEKHFCLSRSLGGVDSTFSLEPQEMKNLVAEIEIASRALGKVYYGPTEAEKDTVKRRRSLYISKDLVEGDILTPDSLRRVRPGSGLPPKYYNLLLGKQVVKNVAKGTPVSWDLLLK